MDLFLSMKAFIATVQAGSMSAAAKQLNITSAMVGQHIAKLEARLGTRLLNRTTRRQNLTDFGASYFDQCQDILERVAMAEMAAEAQSIEALGVLRVTAPVTFGSSLLMPALVRYRKVSPLVKIDVVLTDQNIDLVDERIDIAFRIGEVPDSRLIKRHLLPYKMIVAASPDYIQQRGMPACPDELIDHDIVRFTSSSAAPLTFSKEDATCTVTQKAVVMVNNGQALANAAIGGLGIIIQPEILLNKYILAGSLVRLLPDWTLRERPLSLLYYRDQRMTPRIRSFIEFAIREFRP